MYKVKSESCSVVSDSLRPHGLIHGILQARILEWVAFPFPRGSYQPRNQTGSPALQADSLPTELSRKPMYKVVYTKPSSPDPVFNYNSSA